VSYETLPYDIYSEDTVENIYQVSTFRINLRDDNLAHLIEDHTQFFIQERISSHFDMELPSASFTKTAFANIENQPRTAKESSISITPIDDKIGL
jgi:hypothetical protein